ncbi:MAG: FAD-binding protein [Enhygromyxa sp.]
MSSNTQERFLEPDDDFGHVVQCRPREVSRPGNVEELVEIVAEARQKGTRVVARGMGHSVFGQSQVLDGRLVDMSSMRRVWVEDDFAIAEAGASWSDVVRVTVAHGLTPKVLTDYIGLSVGGTLSVGGIGGSSFRFGSQTDQVRELTVVTGTGDLRKCSATRDSDLFDAVRGGLGQLGVITHAKLPLAQAPSHVRHYRIPYATVTNLLVDLDQLAAEGRMDQVSAVGVIDHAGQWRFHIDAVLDFAEGSPPDDASALAGLRCLVDEIEITDLPYLQYCIRLDAVIASWHTSGLWQAPHPWVDVFVPGTRLLELAQPTVASLGPEDLGTEGAMLLIYPVSTAHASTPLLPLPKSSERAYLFDVLRCTPGASSAKIQQLLGENRGIYEQALELGGSLYPISAVTMTPEDWQRHFGQHWTAFAAAKRRHDPDGLFGGQCRIFAPGS